LELEVGLDVVEVINIDMELDMLDVIVGLDIDEEVEVLRLMEIELEVPETDPELLDIEIELEVLEAILDDEGEVPLGLDELELVALELTVVVLAGMLELKLLDIELDIVELIEELDDDDEEEEERKRAPLVPDWKTTLP
jgi:hypothetical protein